MTVVLVETAGMSQRTTNALMRAGYVTLQSVMECSERELLNIECLGRKGLNELMEWAAANGKCIGKERDRKIAALNALKARLATIQRDIAIIEQQLA